MLYFSFLIIMTILISCNSDNQNAQTQQTQINNTKVQDTTVKSDFIFDAYDINGTLHSSNEWIGKQPVVINFWGTWCPPCRKEIPDLVKAYKEFAPKGVEILGLAVNDQPDKVSTFSEANKMNWKMMIADKELVMRYGISGVPTTIFLDRNGKEIQRFVGPRDFETFKAAFEQIL